MAVAPAGEAAGSRSSTSGSSPCGVGDLAEGGGEARLGVGGAVRGSGRGSSLRLRVSTWPARRHHRRSAARLPRAVQGRRRSAPATAMPSASATLVNRTAATLKIGCFETGSQLVRVSSLAARPASPSGPIGAVVPVAVVEGDEHDTRAGCRRRERGPGSSRGARRCRRRRPHRSPWRRRRRRDLHPDVGRGIVELRDSSGLGARVELVHGAARGQQQRMVGVGELGGRARSRRRGGTLGRRVALAR